MGHPDTLYSRLTLFSASFEASFCWGACHAPTAQQLIIFGLWVILNGASAGCNAPAAPLVIASSDVSLGTTIEAGVVLIDEPGYLCIR